MVSVTLVGLEGRIVEVERLTSVPSGQRSVGRSRIRSAAVESSGHVDAKHGMRPKTRLASACRIGDGNVSTAAEN